MSTTGTTNTGKVKFFNEAKGFGFIIDDQSGADIFVHAKGCRDNIAENDKVRFTVSSGKKGPVAENVSLQ